MSSAFIQEHTLAMNWFGVMSMTLAFEDLDIR